MKWKKVESELEELLEPLCGLMTSQVVQIVTDHLKPLLKEEISRPSTSDSNRNTSASRKAALLAKPKAGSQRERVLLALYHEDLTCDQLEVRLNLPHTSTSARISELKRAGWVRYDETRETPTRAGRTANPLVLTEAGAAIAEIIFKETT